MNQIKRINTKYILSIIRLVDNDAFFKLLIIWKLKQKKHLHKKHIRNIQRKIFQKRYRIHGKRHNYTKAEIWLLQNNTSMRENVILSGLYPKRNYKWLIPTKRKHKNEELELNNFSFIDNPISTLEYFATLAEAESNYALHSYKVNFRDETITDISPYLLLGAIKTDMFPVISGGYMSKHLKQMMKPLRLDKYLDIQIWDDTQNSPNIIALPVLEKEHEEEEIRTTKAEARDIVATKICDQFNGWLKKLCEGKVRLLELSPTGKKNLTGMISEVLENAEKHAEPDKGIGFGKWKATCCMEYTEPDIYQCCISFFNKGQSIAETIQKTTDTKTKNELDAYIKKHKRVDNNCLATVFALQDLISREAKIASQGGLGMMHMVHFIQQIGQNVDIKRSPSIAIISGDTYVKFSGKYITANYDDTGKRHQWFNEHNNSNMPPDENNVFVLKNKISGTIITARFYLDKAMISDEQQK